MEAERPVLQRAVNQNHLLRHRQRAQSIQVARQGRLLCRKAVGTAGPPTRPFGPSQSPTGAGNGSKQKVLVKRHLLLTVAVALVRGAEPEGEMSCNIHDMLPSLPRVTASPGTACIVCNTTCNRRSCAAHHREVFSQPGMSRGYNAVCEAPAVPARRQPRGSSHKPSSRFFPSGVLSPPGNNSRQGRFPYRHHPNSRPGNKRRLWQNHGPGFPQPDNTRREPVHGNL